MAFLAISIVSSDDLSDADVESDLSSGDAATINLENSNPSLNLDEGNDESEDLKMEADGNDNEDFPECNLIISKEGNKKVKVGDEVKWTITVNNSLNTAYNVHVDEKLPKNFKIISIKASQGEYNEEMSYWEVGDLKENKSATLIIKAKALKVGNYTNKVDLITDSKNINGDNVSAKADVKVVNEKANPHKNKKHPKKHINNGNKTKDNEDNSTNSTAVALRNTGGSLFALVVSSLSILGVFIGRRKL